MSVQAVKSLRCYVGCWPSCQHYYWAYWFRAGASSCVGCLQLAAEKRRKAVARVLPAAGAASAQPEPLPSAADSRPAAETNSQETCSNGNTHEQEQPKHLDCTAAVDGDSSHHRTDIQVQSVAVLPEQPGGAPDTQHASGEVDADSSAPPDVDSGHSKELQASRHSDCNGVRAQEDSARLEAESGSSSSTNAGPEQSAAEQKQAGDATDRSAAPQRQQQVVQYLIDGCDQLSDNHQQVC